MASNAAIIYQMSSYDLETTAHKKTYRWETITHVVRSTGRKLKFAEFPISATRSLGNNQAANSMSKNLTHRGQPPSRRTKCQRQRFKTRYQKRWPQTTQTNNWRLIVRWKQFSFNAQGSHPGNRQIIVISCNKTHESDVRHLIEEDDVNFVIYLFLGQPCGVLGVHFTICFETGVETSNLAPFIQSQHRSRAEGICKDIDRFSCNGVFVQEHVANISQDDLRRASVPTKTWPQNKLEPECSYVKIVAVPKVFDPGGSVPNIRFRAQIVTIEAKRKAMLRSTRTNHT